jgi:hypothetical protein
MYITQVRVGDNFSAGGWSGKVRAILHDYDKSIPLAHAGYAACFSVSTHPEIGDPRPLGDRIYFLSNGQNKQDAQVIPALVRKMAPILVEKGAKALAEHIMQQQQMELALGCVILLPLLLPLPPMLLLPILLPPLPLLLLLPSLLLLLLAPLQD